jgi:hypothetical protein
MLILDKKLYIIILSRFVPNHIKPIHLILLILLILPDLFGHFLPRNLLGFSHIENLVQRYESVRDEQTYLRA